jgi:hypothetical protein
VEQLEDATVVSTQAPSTSIVSAELKMPILNAATSAACQACFFLLGDNDLVTSSAATMRRAAASCK